MINLKDFITYCNICNMSMSDFVLNLRVAGSRTYIVCVFVCAHVCVCVCTCVWPPILRLAINTDDGHGLSNEAHCKLLPKKTNCISCSFHSKRYFTSCTKLTKRSTSVIKVPLSGVLH